VVAVVDLVEAAVGLAAAGDEVEAVADPAAGMVVVECRNLL